MRRLTSSILFMTLGAVVMLSPRAFAQDVSITRIEAPSSVTVDNSSGFMVGNSSATVNAYIGQLEINITSDDDWILEVSATFPGGIEPEGLELRARRGGSGAGAYTQVTTTNQQIGAGTGDTPGVIVEYQAGVGITTPPGSYQYDIIVTVTVIP